MEFRGQDFMAAMRFNLQLKVDLQVLRDRSEIPSGIPGLKAYQLKLTEASAFLMKALRHLKLTSSWSDEAFVHFHARLPTFAENVERARDKEYAPTEEEDFLLAFGTARFTRGLIMERSMEAEKMLQAGDFDGAKTIIFKLCQEIWTSLAPLALISPVALKFYEDTKDG